MANRNERLEDALLEAQRREVNHRYAALTVRRLLEAEPDLTGQEILERIETERTEAEARIESTRDELRHLRESRRRSRG